MCEDLNPMLTIPQLIESLKPLFAQGEFDLVHNILVNRENKVKAKFENLENGRNSMKDEILELEKVKLSNKLVLSQRDFEESEERNMRLTEEVSMYNERLKRMEERYVKVCKEGIESSREKKDVIVEMGRRLGEVKDEVWEKCRSLERFKEKLRSCDVKVALMRDEIDELARKKLGAESTVERMRREKLEVDREMEELRRLNLREHETIEELRREKLEVDREMEDLRRLNSRECETIEELRCEKLEVDREMEDLRRLNLRGCGSGEALRRGILVSNDTAQSEKNVVGLEKERERIKGSDLDFEGKFKVVMAKFPSIVSCSLAYEKCGNEGAPSIVSYTKEVVLNGDACESSHRAGAQSVYVSPQAENENNDTVQEKENERLQGPDHNGIVQSRDETSRGNLEEKKKNREKSLSCSSTFDRTSSHPKRKRSSSLYDIMQREKQTRISTSDRDESLNKDFSGELNPKSDGAKTNLPNFFDLPSDGESTDSHSDDSCSTSCINDSIATIKSPKYYKAWKLGVDMLNDFVKDVELCMKAVCVLHRRHSRQQQTTSGSASNEGLCHFNAMGGRALAEYLIDSDSEMRLRKTFNEVKAQRPEALDQCTRLAKDYYALLFSIYCSGEDQFFRS